MGFLHHLESNDIHFVGINYSADIDYNVTYSILICMAHLHLQDDHIHHLQIIYKHIKMHKCTKMSSPIDATLE